VAQDRIPEEPRRPAPQQDAGGSDPSDEATISSRRVDPPTHTHTRIDPDAPIHQSAGSAPRSRSINHVALPPGCTLHEFTIEAVLGSGGFGITYLARDNNLQSHVAIKEYLPTELAIRSTGQSVCARTESDTHGYRIGLERFLAETRVLAGFRHSNIVRVTRFFEANNTAYMVMDFERGQPLREWVKDNWPVDEALLLRMFLPLLDGLDVVHKAGVMHRDIKPANILVRAADGSLVLLDFGAARQAGEGDSRSLTSIVTPGYAPFEQYHAHGAQGPWSDLYALGGVLYWLVTGEKPVEAPSRIRDDRMPAAATAASGRFSRPLLRAIDWALATDERDRPKCVAEFRAVLTGQAAVPARIGEAPATTPVPARSVGIYYAGAAAVLLVLAAGGWLFLSPGATPTATETAAAAPPVPAVAPAAAAPTHAQPAAHARAPAAARSDKAAATKPAGGKGGPTAAAAPAPAVAAAGLAEERQTPEPPVAHLTFDITPRGDVVVDGRKVGSAPPLTRLKLAPGKHKVEIHGSQPPYIYYYTVDLAANESKPVWAKFSASSF